MIRSQRGCYGDVTEPDNRRKKKCPVAKNEQQSTTTGVMCGGVMCVGVMCLKCCAVKCPA